MQNLSAQSSTARNYLPGSEEYKRLLGSAPSNNPRHNTPMRAWIREWDQKWERITGEGKKDGQYLKD